MTKKLFPDHELYLLNKWPDAVALEASMNSTRERYKGILEDALDVVWASHRHLDARGIHLESQYDLNVGIGKKVWPAYRKNWPSGLWLGGIGLESLTSEDEEPPYACIYVAQKDSKRDFLDSVANKLVLEATDMLTDDQRSHIEISDAGDRQHQRLVWWPLVDTRNELLNLLLDDDARGFVNRIAERLESLTRFVPIMDDILQNGSRSRE